MTQRKQNSSSKFQFIDLFAGIGGLRRAFEGDAGIGGRCVFTCERDKFCRDTYRTNYGEETIAEDIREVSENDIPNHDVLLAGFPCQPFSIAGVSKKNALNRPHGFDCEDQGNLFFDVARIVRRHRPKAFLLENVRNLLSHDKGKTFSIIRYVLEEDLQYKLFYSVLNAESWVPQHRKRIFIVGFPNELRVERFTMESLEQRDFANGPKLDSILHPEDGTEVADNRYTFGKSATVNGKYTLTDHLWNYLQRYAEKHRKRGNGFGFGINGPDDVARTLSARYYKDGSEILIRQPEGPPRRLTPRECARLMGFDEPGRPEFQIPVSDTQAYKQFGNAVVPPVALAVAKLMRPFIIGDAVEKKADRASRQSRSKESMVA